MKLLRSWCALGRWGEIAYGIAGGVAVGAVLVGLAALALAKDEIVVNVQAAEPSFASGSDVVLKVTIVNHSQQKLTYFPCPRPYSAEVSDGKGQRVEPKAPAHPQGEEVSVCGANPLISVDRGKTVEDKVKLNDLYDLLAGTYKAKLRWHFQVKFHETAAGSESRSIAVVSNTATVTVK